LDTPDHRGSGDPVVVVHLTPSSDAVQHLDFSELIVDAAGMA
jgi:hypothetical protein